MTFLSWILLLLLLGEASAQTAATDASANCTGWSSESTITMALSSSIHAKNCFVVPGAAEQSYRLILRNSAPGRYSIGEPASGSGYAWNEDHAGIQYCVRGGTHIKVDEFPKDGSLVIKAMALAEGETCQSSFLDYQGFHGLGTITDTVPRNSTSVEWSGLRFYLRADHFEYQVKGEPPVTTKAVMDVIVSGDPGSDAYMTIEIAWHADGQEKRFNVYFNAASGVWIINEIRVYDKTGEWVTFTEDTINMRGDMESCFTADNITVANDNGDTVQFTELMLAAFLPWSNTQAMQDCVNGPALSTSASSESSNMPAFFWASLIMGAVALY